MGKMVIFSKKETKQLYATYGSHDLFNSGAFNPLTRNLTTNKILKRGHHCERCQGKMSIACFNFPDPHYGFCPTYVTRDGRRERCGERFAIRSGGCGRHLNVHGFNKAFYRAASGREVDIENDFTDTDPLSLNGNPNEDGGDWERDQKELEAAAEEVFNELGEIPESFYREYYASCRQREMEAQQLQGMNRRSEEATTAVSKTCKHKNKETRARVTFATPGQGNPQACERQTVSCKTVAGARFEAPTKRTRGFASKRGKHSKYKIPIELVEKSEDISDEAFTSRRGKTLIGGLKDRFLGRK